MTREEIAERIWGKDAYLDLDNSINGAVRKIRQALKDDPEQPRFIQTVTGRGYRFVAPVLGPTEAAAGASPAAPPEPAPPRGDRVAKVWLAGALRGCPSSSPPWCGRATGIPTLRRAASCWRSCRSRT